MGQGIILFPQSLATPDVIVRYMAFIFVAACGAIQIGAALGGINGLLFVRSKRLAILVGALLLLSGFAWFFVWYFTDPTRRPRGLEGNEQTILFALSAAAALAFTVVTASLTTLAQRLYQGLPVVRRSVRGYRADKTEGLDALKDASFIDIVFERIPSARQ